METIISAVKSVQSIDVRENIKVVCKAIDDLKASGKEKDVKLFLEKIDFNSPFEKLVAIKLIDAFKLQDNLISAFSTEDLFVISQSLKCDWFFEDRAGLLDDKGLILDFLSKLSYSGRCKVIRKYAKILKDSAKAERMFSLLEEIYGINVALELLSACSEPFITDLLYSKNVLLPDHVVFQLYMKCPDFTVDFIFSYYQKKSDNKHDFSESYEKTILKIASEKPSLFIEFYNKYGSMVHLDKFGRSLTHKILKVGYSSFLRNIESYLKILHIKIVVSYLSVSQIEEIHYCLLPRDFSKTVRSSYFYKDEHAQVLDHVNPSIAKQFLTKNFKKKYGKDPLDAELDENWIKLFPIDIRTKWVERKLANKDLDDQIKANYSVLVPFDRSFQMLKTLMKTALNTTSRAHIIKCMMINAKLCDDPVSASKIISYVVERHRNDQGMVKEKSLDELREGLNLTRLTVEQWAPILELFNILILNGDINNISNDWVIVYEKWIECRLIHGLSIDAEMETLMKYLSYYYKFSIAKNSKYEEVCLNWFNDNLNRKQFANDQEKFNFATRLFCAINNFNASHSQRRISHKDWILEIVKEQMKKRYSRDEIIKSLKKNKALKNDLYNAIFPDCIFPEVLLHKLAHCVSDIDKNVDVIVNKLINSSNVYHYKTFFQKLLLYSDLPSKFIGQCLKNINSNEEDNRVQLKENSFYILSFLGNPDVFLSSIEPYYPIGPKAESVGTEACEKYRIQTVIASSLKNLNPPFRALEAIKKFSQGDYLKLVLGSLLSVSLKISQSKALELIKENMDKPISFRKHLIRVFKLVASKMAVSNLLLNSVRDEKNISLRIILFNSVLDMIKLEKSESSWETVKQSFIIMTETDFKQLSGRIFSMLDIPIEYQAEYIELIWNSLVRLNFSEENKNKIYHLIDTTNINLIPDQFADHLLSLVYLEEGKPSPQCKNRSFTIVWNNYIQLYLSYSSADVFDVRLNNVGQLIKTIFGDSADKELDSLILLSHLVSNICKSSCSDDISIEPSKLLKGINDVLLKTFPELEIHSIIFSLSLYQIYIKNNKSNVNGFADDICSLVDLLCSTLGPHILHVVAESVTNFVSSHFNAWYLKKSNCHLVVFSHRLVTGPASPLNKIVGVTSLSKVSLDNLKSDSDKNMYKSVIDAIKSSPDPALKIYAKYCMYNL